MTGKALLVESLASQRESRGNKPPWLLGTESLVAQQIGVFGNPEQLLRRMLLPTVRARDARQQAGRSRFSGSLGHEDGSKRG